MGSTKFVGIDVSKNSLTVFVWGQQGSPVEVKNVPSSIADWLETLPKDALIGLESTGGYHKLAAGLAHQSGRTVFILQPRDMSNYRRSVSPRGKTDFIDAQVIARFVAFEHTSLRPWTPPTQQQELIDAYLKGRAFCSRTRASTGLVAQTIPQMEKLLTALEETLNSTISQIDKMIEATIKQIPEMVGGWNRLRTIQGVGEVTGAGLACLLSRHEFKNSDALVGYIGLDPRPMESGQYRGRRRLSKRGPAELRRLLFMAAMAGVRQSAWKPLYEATKAKGLSRIAALCVVARKILRVAFALWKDSRAVFNPTRILKEAPATA